MCVIFIYIYRPSLGMHACTCAYASYAHIYACAFSRRVRRRAGAAIVAMPLQTSAGAPSIARL